MASGKQILLHLILKYSQSRQSSESLPDASEDVRTGLLLHGSTAPESWFDAERIAWISKTNEYGQVQQGLGLRGSDYFLSDILDELTYPEEIPEHIATRFPDLTVEEYHSMTRMMFLIITACEFCSSLESVENQGELDPQELESFCRSYREKLASFRKAPGEFVGASDQEYIEKYQDMFDRIRSDAEE